MIRDAARLRSRLRERLGARGAALEIVAQEARAAGCSAYLVGGPVRDLLLERPLSDLDVMLSADAARVAAACARRLGAELRVHERFGTATLLLGGEAIDLSTARSERYAEPGALPVVGPATPEADLSRRDFSIHALALPLDEATGAALLDPTGGLADLEAGRLRILHEDSFRDDPTRLWRALRYAARLDFELEPDTLRRFRAALRAGWLDAVSGERIAAEIDRGLAEEAPLAGFAAAARRGLCRATSPGWKIGPRVRAALPLLAPPEPAADEAQVAWRAARAALLLDSAPDARAAWLERLAWRGRGAQTLLADVAASARARRGLRRVGSDGALDERLRVLSPLARRLLSARATPAERSRVRHWERQLALRPDPIDGDTASAWGARGAEIGELLRRARRRALDGDPVDERWAARWLARRRAMG